MIFCDIGNTNAHLLINGEISVKNLHEFMTFSTVESVYYINVSSKLKRFLSAQPNFIDLEPYIEFDTKYVGMGIDRKCACRAVRDGVVVDAGSAITVDVMSGGRHLGGYILPGLKAYEKAYNSIAPILKHDIDVCITLNNLPQNTKDALSFAVVKSVVLAIQNSAENRKIYFTGGDGERLSKLFKNAVYDKMLIFKTLQKTVDLVLK